MLFSNRNIVICSIFCPLLACGSADESSYKKFQSLLLASEDACKNELDTRITKEPSADIIVVVSRNDREKEYYESIINKQRSELVRNDVPVVILANPEQKGDFIGSTGAISYALNTLKNRYSTKTIHGKKFNELRIVMIKAGGMARRMIAASIYGNKCMMPLPVLSQQGLMCNTLYFAIRNSYIFTQDMQKQNMCGIVILCSDQLFLSKPETKEGINYIVDPVLACNAKRSELIVEDPATREIIDFKRKPSAGLRDEIILKEQALGRRVWAELTNNYVIAGKSPIFIKKYADYLQGIEKIASLIKEFTSVYEIFTSDFILPFFMTQDHYLTLRMAEYQTKKDGIADCADIRERFYRSVYDIVKQYMDTPTFLSGGIDNTYCEEVTDTIRFYKNGIMPSAQVAHVYHFKNLINSTMSRSVTLGHDVCTFRSNIADNCHIHHGAIILDSMIKPGSRIGHDSIVINMTEKVKIGHEKVLARIPITYKNRKAFAYVYVGLDDNPKNEGPNATIYGKNLKEWADKKGLHFKCDPINIFTIPLFPVTFDDAFDMKSVAWMAEDGKMPSKEYLLSDHISLLDIADAIDYASLISVK